MYGKDKNSNQHLTSEYDAGREEDNSDKNYIEV
jgi:hypothetical protein